MVYKETNNKEYPYTIDKSTFINIGKKVASGFFIDNFSKTIQSINTSDDISKNNLAKIKVVLEVNFDDSSANFLNILHGGSIAILFENIIDILLYQCTKKCHATISSSITYKSQIFLNSPYQIIIQIDKLLFKTVFIEGIIIEIDTMKEINKIYPSLDILKKIIPSANVSLIKELIKK